MFVVSPHPSSAANVSQLTPGNMQITSLARLQHSLTTFPQGLRRSAEVSELGVADWTAVVAGQTGREHSVPFPVGPGGHRGAQEVRAGEPGGGQVDPG